MLRSTFELATTLLCAGCMLPLPLLISLMAFACPSAALGLRFALPLPLPLSLPLPLPDTNVQRVADATVHAATRYIATRINTLIVRWHCGHCNRTQLQQQQQFIDQLLPQLTPHVTFLLCDGAGKEAPRDYMLFVLSEPHSFRHMNLSATYSVHEHEFYFLVVLLGRLPHQELLAAVGHICYVALLSRVINVVVLTQKWSGQVALFTYKLFDGECVHDISPYQINAFGADQELVVKELFPLRFRNLSNCPLTVTGHQLPPQFMYRPADGATLPAEGAFVDLQDLQGIDGELLRLLARALKFRVYLKIPNEKSEVFSADSLDGCFAQLAAGYADLAIGGFSGSDQRRRQFTTSVVYQQSFFIFVVRKHRFGGGFRQLMRPFRRQVWKCLLASFLLVIICCRYLCRYLQLEHPVTDVLSTAIGNAMPARRYPRHGVLRYMLAGWLLLTLVLRSAYQAKLFDVLRSQKDEPLPHSLTDLLRENYTLISTGYHDFYRPELTRVLKENFSHRYELVQNAPPNARLATISLINNLAHWNMRNRNISRLTFVREPIYLYQLVIYFPHNSIFKFTFDRKINQLLSSGVLSHLQQRYIHIAYADLGQTEQLRPRITNRMLHTVYNCFMISMGIAIQLFLLERATLRYPRLRRFLDEFQ